MAILLTRMKLFSPFVKKHFSSKPWLISLAFFLTCIFINSPFIFAFKVESFGSYSNQDSKRIDQYYYFTSSDFSLSPIGRIVLAFTGPFLKIFIMVIADVTLNIVSVSLYRTYIRERREKEREYKPTTSRSEETQVSKKKLTQKEINENKAERNMFLMALK